MQRRTKKHQSKRQRNADMGLDKDGKEPFITFEDAKKLSNILIDQGSGDLQRSMYISDELGKKKQIVGLCLLDMNIWIKMCCDF